MMVGPEKDKVAFPYLPGAGVGHHGVAHRYALSGRRFEEWVGAAVAGEVDEGEGRGEVVVDRFPVVEDKAGRTGAGPGRRGVLLGAPRGFGRILMADDG